MDWSAFMNGELGVFCNNRKEAIAFLGICSLRGLDADRVEQYLIDLSARVRYTFRFDVRQNGLNFLKLSSRDPWDFYVRYGYTSSICRYSEVCVELETAMPSIASIDDLM